VLPEYLLHLASFEGAEGAVWTDIDMRFAEREHLLPAEQARPQEGDCVPRVHRLKWSRRREFIGAPRGRAPNQHPAPLDVLETNGCANDSRGRPGMARG